MSNLRCGSGPRSRHEGFDPPRRPSTSLRSRSPRREPTPPPVSRSTSESDPVSSNLWSQSRSRHDRTRTGPRDTLIEGSLPCASQHHKGPVLCRVSGPGLHPHHRGPRVSTPSTSPPTYTVRQDRDRTGVGCKSLSLEPGLQGPEHRGHGLGEGRGVCS